MNKLSDNISNSKLNYALTINAGVLLICCLLPVYAFKDQITVVTLFSLARVYPVFYLVPILFSVSLALLLRQEKKVALAGSLCILAGSILALVLNATLTNTNSDVNFPVFYTWVTALSLYVSLIIVLINIFMILNKRNQNSGWNKYKERYLSKFIVKYEEWDAQKVKRQINMFTMCALLGLIVGWFALVAVLGASNLRRKILQNPKSPLTDEQRQEYSQQANRPIIIGFIVVTINVIALAILFRRGYLLG